MPSKNPTVSVCMIAYNVENYIEQAMEGVLQQQTNFPVELVIGEDCSTDSTPSICKRYVQQYPDRITYLPNEVNMGIGKNHYRTLMSCQGKYVAVCDSDDVWVDPHKLQYQVDFLEQNPDYGMVYTDFDSMDENGRKIDWDFLRQIRPRYADGEIFFELLRGNFIGNCTVLFRRELLNGYTGFINPINHDWLLWLRFASRTKIHYYDAVTTHYRIHSSGVTNSPERLRKYGKLAKPLLQEVLLDFDKVYKKPLSPEEKALVFRRMLSLIYHLSSTKKRIQLLLILFKYFPATSDIIKIKSARLQKNSSPVEVNAN